MVIVAIAPDSELKLLSVSTPALYDESQRVNISVVYKLHGVKNRPFPLTSHIAYTTACSYRSPNEDRLSLLARELLCTESTFQRCIDYVDIAGRS